MTAQNSTRAAPRTVLRLPRPLRAEIERFARASHPLEACGLLLGKQEGALIEAHLVRPAKNVAKERRHDRYELDPADHLAAEEEARERGLDVVGVWHSHPDQPARPSGTDRVRAWEGWSYVIVSVGAKGAGEMSSWRLVDGRFVEEELLP